MTTDLKVHPAATLSPEMGGEEFARFKADVQVNGQQEKIKLYQGMILDGRHRYRACHELGIEPQVEEWHGDDPVKYVLTMNVYRRHLSESQRAMVAARVANLKREDTLKQNTDASKEATARIPQPEAAAMLNVSRPSVQRAKFVIEHGTEEVVRAVDRGEITVAAAQQLVKLPAGEQRRAAAGGVQGMKKKVRELRGTNGKPRGRPRRQVGKHFAKEDEALGAVVEVQTLVERWNSMGGLKKLVSTWENEKRWKFCDELGEFPSIRASLEYVTGKYQKGLHPPGPFTFLHYECCRRHPDQEEFFDQVLTGANLLEGSPAHVLYKRLGTMTKDKYDTLELLAIAAKAWNATVVGKPIVALRWGRDESFPRIL